MLKTYVKSIHKSRHRNSRVTGCKSQEAAKTSQNNLKGHRNQKPQDYKATLATKAEKSKNAAKQPQKTKKPETTKAKSQEPRLEDNKNLSKNRPS